MKVCNCGASKWLTKLNDGFIQCLKCYAKFPLGQIKKLKDKKK